MTDGQHDNRCQNAKGSRCRCSCGGALHGLKWQTKMTRVCAWCGKGMGEIDGGGQTGTTSGICEDCLKKELAKLRRSQVKI
ncbi:hypothetical protein ES705_28828 [subsurface metagenome]